MKWIKASERPDPGISKYHIIRWGNAATTVFTGDAHAIEYYCMINKVPLSQVEWLDESESPKVDNQIMYIRNRWMYHEKDLTFDERVDSAMTEYASIVSAKRVTELESENERLRGIITDYETPCIPCPPTANNNL